jgi:hypothetical protein
MTIEASNLFLEPLAQLVCSAVFAGGQGHPAVNGVGAAHATAGGGNKLICEQFVAHNRAR